MSCPVENHMFVNLDEAINDRYGVQGHRCSSCSDVILIEHVWEDEIVCSTCYYFFKDQVIPQDVYSE